MHPLGIAALAVVAFLALVFVHDRWISKDNIIRNFPIVGHIRYWLIEIEKGRIASATQRRIGA